MQNRRQAIIWTDDDPIYWHIYVIRAQWVKLDYAERYQYLYCRGFQTCYVIKHDDFFITWIIL